MKNTELKKPEKDQTYLIYVRFSDYYKAKNYRSEFSYFSVFNVTKLISGLTHIHLLRNLQKQFMYTYIKTFFLKLLLGL